MITLIKIGGSLITNKLVQQSFRQDVMQQLALELKQIASIGDQKSIIGHGSGSFGHFEAKKFNTALGVSSDEEWAGFARVGFVAAKLSALVMDELIAVDLPAFRFQPSASIRTEQGVITHMATHAIEQALDHRLIPVVHGDVAFDSVIGGTIASTETIFTYLVKHLPVSTVYLLGEVNGVYDQEGIVIPHITHANYSQFESALGGSEGVDVTGGMLTKVSDMLALTQAKPDLKIRIMNGLIAGNLINAVINHEPIGTLITI